MALRNDLEYSARYIQLTSLEDSTKTDIINALEAKLQQTGCVNTDRCTHTETTVNLVDASRDSSDSSEYVLFTVTITCQPISGTLQK